MHHWRCNTVRPDEVTAPVATVGTADAAQVGRAGKRNMGEVRTWLSEPRKFAVAK
jgi:hypothetical protein